MFPLLLILSNHDSLWVSLFKKKYVKYGSIISSPLSSGSYVWNGIKSIALLLKSRFCYIPHVSCSLAIWFSPWIPTLLNFRPILRGSRLIAQHPLAVSNLINPDSLTWSLSLLTFMFDSSTVTEILSIKIRANYDALLWTASSSGSFITKLAHHLC
jgi:hypothetical protein